MILLPLPPVPKSEIPEGVRIVEFDTLVVPRQDIIEAYTPMRILVPKDPSFSGKMNQIGERAFLAGKLFAQAMRES